jgi:CDP-diacylglycerol---glycerol-3-phosphate 3-phosphatidyltransferase
MKNIINFLTFSRIFLSPVLFILIAYFNFFDWALIIIIFASISDYLDGYLARKYNLTSVLGEILDPIADKILIAFCLIGLTIALESLLIGILTGIILSRELWVSALRDMNARAGNENATRVTFLAKIKTTLQMIAISFYLFALFINSALLIFTSDLILLLAAIVTIKTGISYTMASFRNLH